MPLGREGLFFLSLRVLRDQTQVLRLDNKCPFLLSHLASSQLLASNSPHYTYEDTKAHKSSDRHELSNKHGAGDI